MKFRTVAFASTAAVIAAVAIGSGAAQATSLITGHDVKDGSIHRVDLGAGINHRLDRLAAPGAQGAQSLPGHDGVDGKDGKNGLAGAVYRVENYTNGGGGSATVACDDDPAVSQQYTAISGGVQGGTVDTESPDGFAVNSSFPGRMDWDTGKPKADRLDGWIVLGNGKHTDTLKVWALCVPNTSIAAQTVDLDN